MTGIHTTTTKKQLIHMSSETEKAFVKFDKIDKSYDGDVLVVKNLNLDIAKGDLVKMLGP